MPLLKEPRKFTPRASATKTMARLLNIRYYPSISEYELIQMFRNRHIPEPYQYRLGEIFYDAKRWGSGDLKRFMQENDISIEDVKATYYSMASPWQSREFQEVLDHGELESYE